jgi:chromosome segregation ATPase
VASLAEWDARIQELVDTQIQYQQRVVALEESLTQRDTRIGELEATLVQYESALQKRKEEFEEVGAQLAQAVAVYRTSLLTA